MKANSAGLALIKHYEGLRLIAYADVVGVLTIGYGHTGADVTPGLVITHTHANQLLGDDLAHFESGVGNLVDVPLNANQFSALVSFSYNLGLGNLRQSTLLRCLNRGDFTAAANQFPRWDRAGGRELTGLLKRRQAEQTLFLTPLAS